VGNFQSRIIEAIHEAETNGYSFASIEVVNGIAPIKFRNKARQATNGSRHVTRITKNRLQTSAGILAFRTKHLDEKAVKDYAKTYDLDFFYKIPGYEQDRAIQALDRVLRRHMPPNDKEIAHELSVEMQNGENLEGLLYPTDWKSFKKKFPELTGKRGYNPAAYTDRIKHVKGWVLEQYARLLCQEAMPTVQVFGTWRYKPHEDIDVALIGPHEDIMHGLNSEYFRKIESAKPTPLLSPAHRPA